MDILFYLHVQSTVRSMQIGMLQLSKEKYFIFQLVSFDFNQSFCTQHEENCYKMCRLLL